ncbi:MAG: type VII toxin-antitoxin system MntA family adenylyltransferase antitoxin [Egibacteraceae bacterium]
MSERLRDVAASAFATLPVRFAYLFGSQVDGRPRPDSDVDVAILVDEAVPEDAYDRLSLRCADALTVASGIPRIEVTILNRAHLRFVGRVLRQRVVLFSRDEPVRVAYESRMGRMADDVEVWAAPLDRELLAAIAEGRR